MNIETDALWFLLVGSAIIGAAGLLLSRLQGIERELNRHGLKLVRIETKLGIVDPNGDA